jgi:hypothetical protein
LCAVFRPSAGTLPLLGDAQGGHVGNENQRREKDHAAKKGKYLFEGRAPPDGTTAGRPAMLHLTQGDFPFVCIIAYILSHIGFGFKPQKRNFCNK